MHRSLRKKEKQMNEPNVTVHNEATRKSIKTLQLASFGVWCLSLSMWAASDDPAGGLMQVAVLVWLVSVIMLGTAMVKKLWHHG